MCQKITDVAIIAACRFICEYYQHLGSLAPKKGSPQEQHAILVLAEYIRAAAKSEGK